MGYVGAVVLRGCLVDVWLAIHPFKRHLVGVSALGDLECAPSEQRKVERGDDPEQQICKTLVGRQGDGVSGRHISPEDLLLQLGVLLLPSTADRVHGIAAASGWHLQSCKRFSMSPHIQT